MSDDLPWLADAVEAACRAFCYAEGECPCATSAECGRWWHVSVDMRAALAAFLRHFPKDGTLCRWKDGETGHVARLPSRELHYLASAVERLDAPEKPEGGA